MFYLFEWVAVAMYVSVCFGFFCCAELGSDDIQLVNVCGSQIGQRSMMQVPRIRFGTIRDDR